MCVCVCVYTNIVSQIECVYICECVRTKERR